MTWDGGRKAFGLLRRLGLRDVHVESYAIQLCAPLSAEAKRHVAGNALWYSRMGAPYLEEADIRAFDTCFDPDSEEYILDDDELDFCMVETVATGLA